MRSMLAAYSIVRFFGLWRGAPPGLLTMQFFSRVEFPGNPGPYIIVVCACSVPNLMVVGADRRCAVKIFL
jgi:hypothetical protein